MKSDQKSIKNLKSSKLSEIWIWFTIWNLNMYIMAWDISEWHTCLIYEIINTHILKVNTQKFLQVKQSIKNG